MKTSKLQFKKNPTLLCCFMLKGNWSSPDCALAVWQTASLDTSVRSQPTYWFFLACSYIRPLHHCQHLLPGLQGQDRISFNWVFKIHQAPQSLTDSKHRDEGEYRQHISGCRLYQMTTTPCRLQLIWGQLIISNKLPCPELLSCLQPDWCLSPCSCISVGLQTSFLEPWFSSEVPHILLAPSLLSQSLIPPLTPAINRLAWTGLDSKGSWYDLRLQQVVVATKEQINQTRCSHSGSRKKR